MKVIDALLEVVEKVYSALAAVLMVGMLYSLSVQVIARKVFNTGFAWTEESARYMMVLMVFLGAVVCTKQGTHVAVDAIEEMVPRLRSPMKVIQLLFTLVYCGVVFKFGVDSLATAALQTSPNMKIPMNYIYLVFPVAMVCIAVYVLRHLVAVFRGERYSAVKDEVTEALESVGAQKEEAK